MGMWTIPKNEDNSKFKKEELDEFIEKISVAVKARQMSVPVIMALEMAKPVSFLGYSTLVVFAPILELVFDPVKVEKLQSIFSDRNLIEKLMTSIEDLENSEKEKIKEGKTSEQS